MGRQVGCGIESWGEPGTFTTLRGNVGDDPVMTTGDGTERLRANFGKLLDRVADDRGSLVIEKRGTPKAVIPPISLDGTGFMLSCSSAWGTSLHRFSSVPPQAPG